jgi:hypothetical protein
MLVAKGTGLLDVIVRLEGLASAAAKTWTKFVPFI